MRSHLNKFGLTTSIAFAAAVLLGVASAAQAAADHEDQQDRASHVGPTGQYLGGRTVGGPYAFGSASYVPRYHRTHRSR
jgi:hypothetical protein